MLVLQPLPPLLHSREALGGEKAAGDLQAREVLGGGWYRFELASRESMFGWTASSVLDAESPFDPSRYGPEKALDGDPATSWVEGGEKAGIGESYILGLDHVPEAMGFHNGYAKNDSLFAKNHRVKEFTVQIFAAVTVSGLATEKVTAYDARPISEARTLRLADSRKAQRVPLPFDPKELHNRMREFRSSSGIENWNFPLAEEAGLTGDEGLARNYRFLIEFVIAEVYRGSTWEDTCIAELWPDYGMGEEVFVTEDGRYLGLRKAGAGKVHTCYPFSDVLTLLEVSSNNEWAIVIREPAYPEVGERVRSAYSVVHVPSGRDLTEEVFGPIGVDAPLTGMEFLPTGFAEEGGRLYVEYEDFAAGETRKAPCRLYEVTGD